MNAPCIAEVREPSDLRLEASSDAKTRAGLITELDSMSEICRDALRAVSNAMVRLREYQGDMHACRKGIGNPAPGWSTLDSTMSESIDSTTAEIMDDLVAAMENINHVEDAARGASLKLEAAK